MDGQSGRRENDQSAQLGHTCARKRHSNISYPKQTSASSLSAITDVDERNRVLVYLKHLGMVPGGACAAIRFTE